MNPRFFFDFAGVKIQETHIWLCLDRGEDIPAHIPDIMDQGEHLRYRKYLTADKQREFLLGKVFTRKVLAQYLQEKPENVPILLNGENKPYVPGCPFFFNLSHSGGALALIVAPVSAGIDVEYMRKSVLRGYYQHVFTQAEIEGLQRLSGEAQLMRFFEIWTLKEAFWKALDQSAHIPFNDFGFSFSPIVLHQGSVGLPQKQWSFTVATWNDDFMLATAVETTGGDPLPVKVFEKELSFVWIDS
ncbi:MAG: 4'-phosphopantetheinyl transferase superfamily protein [Bacteroidia bacterium]